MSTECWIEVVFFADRPMPPRNVVASDIKSESCYLTWDAPEDNGGSDITNYIVERRDASKKKSDFEVLTINLIDRRYGVSSNTNKIHSQNTQYT